MRRIYPTISIYLINQIFTKYSLCSYYESPLNILASPTISIPITESTAPAVCDLRGDTLRKNTVKIKQVMMSPPLNIWYPETDIKFKAKKFKAEVNRSHIVGTKR